jgi:acetyl esterase/lipase
VPRHHVLLAAVAIVALAAAAIGAGILLGDDDGTPSGTDATSSVVVTLDEAANTTTPTTVPPTVAGTRYRDEVFREYTLDANLQYGEAPGGDGTLVPLLLDLYRPAGDTETARPAVVWVHGGGFKNGDKAAGPAVIMAPAFAKLGYVVVSINYRLLAPEGCTGVDGITPQCYTAAIEAVHDGQAAVRWLRANATTYGIDPDRIVIGGESAGAIVATGVGVYADQPGVSGNPGYTSTVRAWVSISGGVPAGLFVDASDSPGLLISGTADDVVPYQWSVETANALAAAGVEHRLTTLEGAGHVPFVEYGEKMEQESIEFFYEQLDLAA